MHYLPGVSGRACLGFSYVACLRLRRRGDVEIRWSSGRGVWFEGLHGEQRLTHYGEGLGPRSLGISLSDALLFGIKVK